MRDPINPAEIRVGDRVERRHVLDGLEAVHRFVVSRATEFYIHGCGRTWIIADNPEPEWFLLDRPDPLAEVVGEAARALWRYYEAEGEADPEPDSEYSMAYRSAARTIVAAISERWELVEKNG